MTLSEQIKAWRLDIQGVDDEDMYEIATSTFMFNLLNALEIAVGALEIISVPAPAVPSSFLLPPQEVLELCEERARETLKQIEEKLT